MIVLLSIWAVILSGCWVTPGGAVDVPAVTIEVSRVTEDFSTVNEVYFRCESGEYGDETPAFPVTGPTGEAVIEEFETRADFRLLDLPTVTQTHIDETEFFFIKTYLQDETVMLRVPARRNGDIWVVDRYRTCP